MDHAFVRREIGAGLSAALVAVPICISSGVLAYAPLGLGYIARGAVAGLTSGAFAAIVAAFVASSSFVISSPRASISLIQASVAAFLLRNESFAGNPDMIIDAVSLCAFLAGVWQVLFGVFGIDRIIKSTPHPALAGFINGVALLVILGQLALLLDIPGDFRLQDLAAFGDPGTTAKLIFALLLVGLVLYLSAKTERWPVMIIVMAVGTLLFFGVRHTVPAVPLGPTIGDIPDQVTAIIPLTSLLTERGRAAFIQVIPALLISSLVLALVGALESLLAYRVAQNLSEQTSEASRDVIGQGFGNLLASLLGGVASAASSAQLTANYEAGGRSRLSVLAAATVLLALSQLSPILSIIPAVVIWAILLAVGMLLFDEWSLRALRDILFKGARAAVVRGWRNHMVAATVMIITASGAVIGGTLVGIGLSCILFIADMSRSIIRRRYRGDEVFSKRVRPPDDMAMLRESGGTRAVLELNGVMFFGNADELSREVDAIFKRADMVLLDLEAVTDIDFSAASILRYELAKSARHRKALLFSGVPPAAHELLTDPLSGAALPSSAIFADRDAALEWMEERALSQASRAAPTGLPLSEHQLFNGLTPEEFAVMERLIEREQYPAGTILCREGDEADRMWILTRGSVSVRVLSVGQTRDRRIASLAFGTIVGEIAFVLEGGRRTATIIADDDIECYVLNENAYATIVRDHPAIGIKLIANMLREVVQRLRITSDELRVMTR
jgi:sulfate permease, SulP family